MSVNATVQFFAYISGNWVQLKDVQPVSGEWGITDNKPTSRIASPGTLNLQLNNNDGRYSPQGPSALTGWQKGIPFKMVVTYQGKTYIRFYGFVEDIVVKQHNLDPMCYVTVLDWLDYAQRFAVINPSIQTNQTGDQYINSLLSLMAIQPQAKNLSSGFEIFPTIFDAVTSETKAFDELSKIALSELGYVYLQKDKIYGETLRFESTNDRYGWKPTDTFPIPDITVNYLLKSGSADKVLTCAGDKLLLNNPNLSLSMTIQTDPAITEFETPYGDYQVNRMTVTAYPRLIDTSSVVLFTLSTPVPIPAGLSITIKGTYANPSGGLPVNGMNMITPAATTDFLANTLAAGGGTDFTSDIVVTPVYGTEGFTHLVTNTGSHSGYIIKFNCRGKGVYKYNPISAMPTDATSINTYGYESESLDQVYKVDYGSGATFANSIIEDYKNPNTLLTSITMCANNTNNSMYAFLLGDVGQLYNIIIPEAGINGRYYIEGVSFDMQNGVIMFKWIVKLAILSLLSGLTPISVEYSGYPALDTINYGYLPRVSGDSITARSFSAWVYPTSGAAMNDGVIIWLYSTGNNSGVDIYQELGTNKICIISGRYSTLVGKWKSSGTVTLNQWNHVVVTYDHTSTANVPNIYINGTLQSLTTVYTPTGTLTSEAGVELAVGNVAHPSVGFQGTYKGQIYDVQIYPRVISQAEVTTLYNSGTPDATVYVSNMAFQAPNVKTTDLSKYVNQILTTGLNVRDAQYGAVGYPYGTATGRAHP